MNIERAIREAETAREIAEDLAFDISGEIAYGQTHICPCTEDFPCKHYCGCDNPAACECAYDSCPCCGFSFAE